MTKMSEPEYYRVSMEDLYNLMQCCMIFDRNECVHQRGAIGYMDRNLRQRALATMRCTLTRIRDNQYSIGEHNPQEEGDQSSEDIGEQNQSQSEG